MSVSQYTLQFQSLSRFASDLVSSEERKCKRFKKGLHPSIQRTVMGHRLRMFSELVDCAREVEPQGGIVKQSPIQRYRPWEPHRQGVRSSLSPSSSGFGKKSFRGQSRFSRDQRPQGSSGSVQGPATCHRCGKAGHFKVDCRVAACHFCGQVGHLVHDCPRQSGGSRGARPHSHHQQQRSGYQRPQQSGPAGSVQSSHAGSSRPTHQFQRQNGFQQGSQA